jgi:general stress protein 26
MKREVFKMNKLVIENASKIINESLTKNVAVAVLNDEGYPNASTYMIAKANGVEWLTFCTSLSRDIVKRLRKDNRGSVCINSDTYNITLVGRFEILTDQETRQANWYEGFTAHWSGIDDPEYCVLRFNTEYYNLDLFGVGDAKGTISNG